MNLSLTDPQRRNALIALALFLIGPIALASACGGSDPSPDSGAGAPPPSEIAPGKPPASARDERGDAPDDGISDRPGGPSSGRKSG